MECVSWKPDRAHHHHIHPQRLKSLSCANIRLLTKRNSPRVCDRREITAVVVVKWCVQSLYQFASSSAFLEQYRYVSSFRLERSTSSVSALLEPSSEYIKNTTHNNSNSRGVRSTCRFLFTLIMASPRAVFFSVGLQNFKVCVQRYIFALQAIWIFFNIQTSVAQLGL